VRRAILLLTPRIERNSRTWNNEVKGDAEYFAKLKKIHWESYGLKKIDWQPYGLITPTTKLL